jgi:PiT family inorganic phosphate transporter
MAGSVALSSSEGGLVKRVTSAGLIAVFVFGLYYVTSHLASDLVDAPTATVLEYVLLGVALLIALGFEFVNGFHDTANAVATVIYTHSLPPNIAVVWSGLWNFAGVLTSTGAVAFGIVSLLPVELILQVGSSAGFAMVFALLVAAIIWNLGTWWLGLPSSSSHTLIGSIIGVGVMNSLLNGGSGTSGVDWGQATSIGETLLVSPIIGFGASYALLLLTKLLVKNAALYKAPEGKEPPPIWIRGLLVLTCTGVSFAHGSNDGQKGMGLIMLILIGTVPTAYALNRTVTPDQMAAFAQVSEQAVAALGHYVPADAPPVGDYKKAVTDYIRTRVLEPGTVPALQALAADIGRQVETYPTITAIPNQAVGNIRNDMYLANEGIRLIQKANNPAISGDDVKAIKAWRGALDRDTKFIPTWVKVAVAIALGLGTMIGWKRIVVTVGEKIGKEHLTYAQGASAELVAMATIGMADVWGLPVSTTHVLSSGVAGTMAANGSGLQMSTVRNLAAAWVLTLPVSIALSGALFWIFRAIF